MTLPRPYDPQNDIAHRDAHPRRHRAGDVADASGQGRADDERRLYCLARRLEVQESAVALEVFHVTAIGEGHLGHQPHEPLNADEDRFRRVMGKQARGTRDVDEERGQPDTRREPPLPQVALGEAGQARPGYHSPRLIANERFCREARLPPAGEATAEHRDARETMIDEPPRHPGAGRLTWSRAVHHQVLSAGEVLRSPGNFVVGHPDRARDTLAILAPALRPPDVEDRDWLVAAKPRGERGSVYNAWPIRVRDRHWLAFFRAHVASVLVANGVSPGEAPF